MDAIRCPENFETEWHTNIEQVIKARISEMVRKSPHSYLTDFARFNCELNV